MTGRLLGARRDLVFFVVRVFVVFRVVGLPVVAPDFMAFVVEHLLPIGAEDPAVVAQVARRSPQRAGGPTLKRRRRPTIFGRLPLVAAASGVSTP